MTSSQHIDQQIAALTDWRGQALKKLRTLIHQADPDITEEWKWDTGVWTHNGMVCALGAFQEHVKINFFKGAKLTDSHGLFNSGLDSKQHRSINFQEHDSIPDEKILELIRAAVALNQK